MALFSRPVPERIRDVLRLTRYYPEIKLQSLAPGVDNIRHDVRLSPRLMSFTSGYVYALFIKHSGARKFLDSVPTPPGAAERSEFKKMVSEILVGALSQARAVKNQELDLLANLALFKYFNWEIQQQYAKLVLQAKNKLKLFEGPKYASTPKAAELRQAVGEFQAAKKISNRLVAQELQRTVNEVQADTVRKTRESFFGLEGNSWFAYFSNPLLFCDNGRDDYVHLEKYAMFGNFIKDPDRFECLEEWLRNFLRAVDIYSAEAREVETVEGRYQKLCAKMEELRKNYVPAARQERRVFGKLFGGGSDQTLMSMPASQLSQTFADLAQQMIDTEAEMRTCQAAYEEIILGMMNAPENIEEMLSTGRTEEALADARRKGNREEVSALESKLEIQKLLQDELYKSADKAGLLPFVAACYEVARIYADYCPPINPQNLKVALLKPEERDKVAELIRTYRMPESRLNTLRDAAERVRTAASRDLRSNLVRFVADYFRHHRDTRNYLALQALLDRLHLPMEERAEQLSRINGTLYEFLISSEEQPVERKVCGHVIMKADIRDSTRLTIELMSRGLNPASYFSLNFYDPLNKILPRYGAEKVFIEGDAVILALFEYEGGRGNAVALASGLAREMTEIVKLYNTKSEAGGLPKLEIGIGITYRNNPPLYLLDGENRIMISEALNLSDRLSGCHKLARKSLPNNTSAFNVFVLQTISEEMAAGAMEEFLVRYNVNGICLSEDAFEKLRTEINFSRVEGEFPLLWGQQRVQLYSGAVPLSSDVYQRLVVREGIVPFVDPHTFKQKDTTQRRYYELCTNKAIYDFTDRMVAGGAA